MNSEEEGEECRLFPEEDEDDELEVEPVGALPGGAGDGGTPSIPISRFGESSRRCCTSW